MKCSYFIHILTPHCCYTKFNKWKSGERMKEPRKEKYLYAMLAGFGSISLSVLLFFFLYRLQGIGEVLSKLSGILAPFIYGGVVAYLLRPMCNSFEDFFQLHLPKNLKRFSNSAAVVLSMITGIMVVYALIIMIGPQLYISITTLWTTLPQKAEQLMKWAIATFGEDERLVQFFNENYLNYITDVDKWFRENVVPQVTTIVSGVGTSVWRILMFLYNLLIGLIVAIYVLHGRKRFSRQAVLIVRSSLPDRWADLLLEEISFVDKMFGGFIDGKIMDSAIVGVLCYIGCSILRIPNPLLVSVLIGLTNIIPFFGPFIGAIPSFIIILINSPIQSLYFLIFVLALQQFDGNILGPKILGNSTGLPSFWVLFAILLFGGLFGFIGMLIGVPVFAVLTHIFKDILNRRLKQQHLPTETASYAYLDHIDGDGNPVQHKPKQEQEAQELEEAVLTGGTIKPEDEESEQS